MTSETRKPSGARRLIRPLAVNVTLSYVMPALVCTALGRLLGIERLVDEAFTTIAISSATAATVAVLVIAARTRVPVGSRWLAQAATVAAVGCATAAALVAAGLAAANLLDEGSVFHAALSAALGGALTTIMYGLDRWRAQDTTAHLPDAVVGRTPAGRNQP